MSKETELPIVEIVNNPIETPSIVDVTPEDTNTVTINFSTAPVLFTTENEGLRYQINVLSQIQSLTPEGVVSSEWQSVDEFMQYMNDLRVAPKSPFLDSEEQMINFIGENSTKV